jgi:hypothetical protein
MADVFTEVVNQGMGGNAKAATAQSIFRKSSLGAAASPNSGNVSTTRNRGRPIFPPATSGGITPGSVQYYNINAKLGG